MARRRHGQPGLAVNELHGTSLGTNDIQQGKATVFIKSSDPAEHPVVLHEFLAARLAHSMGIPVPFGEVAYLPPKDRGWASAVLGTSGQAAAPADIPVAAADEPHIFAGICVFDIWIHNIDRSDENTYYSKEFGLWAIDHEKAFGEHNPYAQDADITRMAQSVETPYRFQKVTPDAHSVWGWQRLIHERGAEWAHNACEAARRRGLADKVVLEGYEGFLKGRSLILKDLISKVFDFDVKPLW